MDKKQRVDSPRHSRLGQSEVTAGNQRTGPQEGVREYTSIFQDEELQETPRTSEGIHTYEMVGQMAREVQVLREGAIRHLVISDSCPRHLEQVANFQTSEAPRVSLSTGPSRTDSIDRQCSSGHDLGSLRWVR